MQYWGLNKSLLLPKLLSPPLKSCGGHVSDFTLLMPGNDWDGPSLEQQLADARHASLDT